MHNVIDCEGIGLVTGKKWCWKDNHHQKLYKQVTGKTQDNLRTGSADEHI